MNDETDERFWARVPRMGAGCWEWQGHRGSAGHGQFAPTRSGHVYAHRYSWAFHYGPIPSGMVVRHRCDNPPCVNPEHLILGTQAENIRDAALRGRTARGERGGMAKLTNAQVAEIRRRFQRHSPRRTNAAALGHEFGVAASHVRAIAAGTTRRFG